MDLMKNKKKHFIKKTRKDGSCFYWCFIYKLFECLIGDKSLFEKYKILDKVKLSEKEMIDANFEKVTFEDFIDVY